MMTYDRNRNAITTGSRVMISGTGKTGVIKAIHSDGLAWDTIENIKATIDRVRYMSLDHVSPPEMLLRQHHDIFSALEKRDPDGVEKAMTLHLQEISESVQLIRQENSEWFSEE